MTITPATLIRLAGLAGILAGTTFVSVQIGHRPQPPSGVGTPRISAVRAG